MKLFLYIIMFLYGFDKGQSRSIDADDSLLLHAVCGEDSNGKLSVDIWTVQYYLSPPINLDLDLLHVP